VVDRAGQGRIVEAETVSTAPAKVSAKSEETNDRRWAFVIRIGGMRVVGWGGRDEEAVG